jgi:MerR family transcriptional regulator, copper efflux regulator
MTDQFTIGQLAQQTGVPIRTIRFYEAEGVLPQPARSLSGYRLYSPIDARRLRLARNAKRLGLTLPQVKTLVAEAFQGECQDYGELMLGTLTRQQEAIDHQIAQLQALKAELATVEQEIRHDVAHCPPGQQVQDCTACAGIDQKGESDDAMSVPLPMRRMPLRLLAE